MISDDIWEDKGDHTVNAYAISDLKSRIQLMANGDIVAFLYREDYYNPETENKNITELIIAKHRNGPVDTVNLFFHKQYTKFVGLSKRKE